MPRNLKSFVRDQRGASMPEYALLLFAVLISAAAAAKRVGPRVSIAGDVTRRLLAGEDVTVDGAGGGALGGMAASVPGSSAGGGSSGSGVASSAGGSSDNGSGAGSSGSFGGSSSGGAGIGSSGGGGGSIGSSGSSSGFGGGSGFIGGTGSQSINGGSGGGSGSDFGAPSNASSGSGALAIGPQSTDGLGASSSNASNATANNLFGSSAPARASSSNALPQGFLGGTGAQNSAQNSVNPPPPSSSTEPGVTGDGYTISANGEKEMQTLLAQAKKNADGKRPLGYCYRQVKEDIAEVGYGDIAKQGNTSQLKPLPGADQEYAHDFADYMNAKAANGHTNADNLGLQKLPITNPYDAPPGSIIVVRAGTPGTRNPVAGDIVVAGGGGKFYNDGNMGYGGSKNFPAGNNYVLGIYAPK